MYIVDVGKKLFLRPIEITDANDLYEYAQDDQVTKYLTWDTYINIKQAVDNIKNLFLKHDPILLPVYAIIYQNKMIGTVSIVEHKENYGYLGYCLNRNYWEQGIMSKVVEKFIQIVHDSTQFKGLYAKVVCENNRSIGVLKKNGFLVVKNMMINKRNKNMKQELFLLEF